MGRLLVRGFHLAVNASTEIGSGTPLAAILVARALAMAAPIAGALTAIAFR